LNHVIEYKEKFTYPNSYTKTQKEKNIYETVALLDITCMLIFSAYPKLKYLLVMVIGNIFKIDDRYINIELMFTNGQNIVYKFMIQFHLYLYFCQSYS
jgi:hypothetical protein